jgi:putative transposase
MDSMLASFSRKPKNTKPEMDEELVELCKTLGKLALENEELKTKVRSLSLETRKEMIDKDDPTLSVRRQCEILGVSRGTYYYAPKPENELNITLMKLIEEKYAESPNFGKRRMCDYLNQHKTLIKMGVKVNVKRVRRLMEIMGIEGSVP